jgi:hypothetical protein
MPRRHGVPAFRGVAAIVSQARVGEDSATGWVALIAQLGRSVQLIAKVHAARHEHIQAEQLVKLSVGELQLLQDRWHQVSLADLAPRESTEIATVGHSKRPLVASEEIADMARRQSVINDHGLGR